MNWDRNEWEASSDYLENTQVYPLFSNLTHSHQEVFTSAPNGSKISFSTSHVQKYGRSS